MGNLLKNVYEAMNFRRRRGVSETAGHNTSIGENTVFRARYSECNAERTDKYLQYHSDAMNIDIMLGKWEKSIQLEYKLESYNIVPSVLLFINLSQHSTVFAVTIDDM